jgi:hypothetical protein
VPTTPEARRLWRLFEPIHDVTYFCPEARAAFEQAGLRGFWRGYFAGRAAPLGAVGTGAVYATFFNFARPMVTRAVPDVWSRATPEATLDARRTGARTALQRILSTVDIEDVAAAADAARRAAEAAEVAGRPLGAANAALPWPDDPVEALWQATTVLREHRGDGHVAALVATGLDGIETLALRAALDDSRQVLQPNRGWTDEEWDAAVGRLAERGWLTPAGQPTDAGRSAYQEVEDVTDRLAAQPLDRIGAQATQRLAELLRPLAKLALADLPTPNPIGMAAPNAS